MDDLALIAPSVSETLTEQICPPFGECVAGGASTWPPGPVFRPWRADKSSAWKIRQRRSGLSEASGRK